MSDTTDLRPSNFRVHERVEALSQERGIGYLDALDIVIAGESTAQAMSAKTVKAAEVERERARLVAEAKAKAEKGHSTDPERFVGTFLESAADKADALGDHELAEAFRRVERPAGGGPPAGIDLDRAELNRQVERFMAENPDADITEALEAVAFASATKSKGAKRKPGTGAPPGHAVDPEDREALNRRVEAWLAKHPGKTISEAIEALEKEMA
jgi:hypothetical protein